MQDSDATQTSIDPTFHVAAHYNLVTRPALQSSAWPTERANLIAMNACLFGTLVVVGLVWVGVLG